MSYLLDKKNQRKKIFSGAIFVFVFLIIFYFRVGVWNGFSYVTSKIFSPFLVVGRGVSEKFGSLHTYFLSKNSLYQNNLNLKSDLESYQAQISNYNTVVADDATLKDMLGRNDTKTKTMVATILSKPNKSLYDTLVIDIGSKNGIKVGSVVLSLGYTIQGDPIGVVPIGKVSEVYDTTSKVVLFSNPGEHTQVVTSQKDVYAEVVGRGGGNFEMVLPKGSAMQKGDQVVLPGINSYIVGIVQTILSDPRDAFAKALISSPVNIQELKFVEVEE